MKRTEDHNQLVKISQRLTNRVVDAKDSLDKFAAKFKENPLHALEWADDTFTAAARYQVYLRACDVFERLTKKHGEDVETIVRTFHKHLLTELTRATCGVNNKSTSTSSNMLRDNVAAVWAQLVQDTEFDVLSLADA